MSKNVFGEESRLDLDRVNRDQTWLSGRAVLPGGSATSGTPTIGEGPDIDLVIAGVSITVGRGGDTILLFDSAGAPVAEFAATSAGLTLALAAATAGDVVWLPAVTIALSTAPAYTPGAEIDTGAITVTSEAGHEISGLTIGNWYCIEGFNGYWTAWVGEPLTLSTMSFSDGSGFYGSVGRNQLGEDLLNAPAWCAYAECFDGADTKRYGRVYFQAPATSVFVRVPDGPGKFADNTGTLSWRLSDATYDAGSISIPDGVELVGLGENSVLDGAFTNNGILTNLKVTGTISGTGAVRMVSNPAAQLFSRQIRSAVPEGTAPLVVGSTTLVTNLNADLLDGHHWSEVGASGWYSVVTYGATGDGVTDDTAAIALAIAAIPAGGGVLYFPPGEYVTTGGFTLAYPTLVMGCGEAGYDGDNAVTQINCTSATAVLFTVTANRAEFSRIALKNTAAGTPTAGAGIQVSGTDQEQRVSYDHISTWGFYINVDVRVGANWSMHSCYIAAPVQYGVKINNTVNDDAGDWSIVSCNIYGSVYDSAAGIRIEGSGGGKVVNTKINCRTDLKKFNHGIDVAAGATCATGQLMVANTSFENVRANGINVSTSGGGKWFIIILTGLQFGIFNATGSAIAIAAATLGDIYDVVIGNCAFHATISSGPAISLTKVDRALIMPCINDGFTPLLAQTGCTNVVDATTPATGTVTSVATGTGLTGGPITSTGTVALANTAVTPGAYTNADITVDQQGRLTAASSGTATSASLLFSQITDATVGNTTGETTVLGTGRGSKTLDADTLDQGFVIAIVGHGYLSTSGTPTLNLKVTLGGTLVCSTGAVTLADTIADQGFSFRAEIACRVTGASGSVVAGGTLEYSSGNQHKLLKTSATAIDTTAALAVDVTATWGAAHASNTMTLQVATIELVKADELAVAAPSGLTAVEV